MDFGGNKMPIEVIKGDASEEHISETFILVLMKSGTKSHGKNLISLKILIKNIIVQIIIFVLINMLLSVEHHLNFGKIKVGLMK